MEETKKLIYDYAQLIKSKGDAKIIQEKKIKIAKILQEDLRKELANNFARQFLILESIARGADAIVEGENPALTLSHDRAIIITQNPKIYPIMIDNSCRVRFDFRRREADYYMDILDDAIINISVVGEEHKMFMTLLRASVNLNTIKIKDFNISVLDMLATEMPKPPATLLIEKGTWDSVLDNKEFIDRYEPAVHTLVLEGNLGCVKLKRGGDLIKVEIKTDMYRDPHKKIMKPNEFFLLPLPVDLGVICEKKAITVETMNVNPKEFFCEEIVGMVLKAHITGRI